MHEVETMAYAGETPWHGLGTKVDDTLTPDEMLVEAGLDWTVSKRDLYTHDTPTVTDESDLLVVPKHSVLVRDSDNTVFGPCGPRFVPTQNKDAFGFFKKFTEGGHMNMDTAGSLRNGEKVWGLARINESFSLAGDDKVDGYLLIAVSHQWGVSNQIRFTPVRVVCNNTLSYALNTHSCGVFKMPHVRAMDEEVYQTAEQALGIASEQMNQYKETAEYLSKKRYTDENVINYISELLQPELLEQQIALEKETDMQKIVNRQTMLNEFQRTPSMVYQALEQQPGAELDSSKGTWWCALNAVTFIVDHKWGHDRDAALHNAWFGGRASLKQKAMEKAVEYARAA